MLVFLLFAACLIAATVMVHAVGLVVAFLAVESSIQQREPRFWPTSRIIVNVALGLIGLHLLEIAIWAFFFWWQKCMPDLETSFYFSGVTYATIGYGDVVLSKEWRLFGPLEGLAGILMCGLSVGFFAAVMIRLNRARTEKSGT